MLLENKNAIIYGAGGSIGGAVAKEFAREGAKVFLAGRTLESLEEVAEEIIASGGVADFGSDTLLGRLPKVAEVADVATLMASDRASAMTGTIANVTCGSVVD
jgi:NAD(P)-dependent dehydrogenase (short-subunit alcohol dehydrogenase family)